VTPDFTATAENLISTKQWEEALAVLNQGIGKMPADWSPIDARNVKQGARRILSLGGAISSR